MLVALSCFQELGGSSNQLKPQILHFSAKCPMGGLFTLEAQDAPQSMLMPPFSEHVSLEEP
jgi:hypothetical protein